MSASGRQWAVVGLLLLAAAAWIGLRPDAEPERRPDAGLSAPSQPASAAIAAPRAPAPTPPSAPAQGPPPTLLVGPDPLQAMLDHQVEFDQPIRWEPIPWDLERVPEDVRPDGFRAILAEFETDETCALHGELLFVDCAEPPCFGVYRADSNRGVLPSQCPAWLDRYGGTLTRLQVTIPCRSGDVVISVTTPHVIVQDALPEGITRDDVNARYVARFYESLDQEAVCRDQEERSVTGSSTGPPPPGP